MEAILEPNDLSVAELIDYLEKLEQVDKLKKSVNANREGKPYDTVNLLSANCTCHRNKHPFVFLETTSACRSKHPLSSIETSSTFGVSYLWVDPIR
jgi:hypothetical protein